MSILGGRIQDPYVFPGVGWGCGVGSDPYVHPGVEEGSGDMGLSGLEGVGGIEDTYVLPGVKGEGGQDPYVHPGGGDSAPCVLPGVKGGGGQTPVSILGWRDGGVRTPMSVLGWRGGVRSHGSLPRGSGRTPTCPPPPHTPLCPQKRGVSSEEEEGEVDSEVELPLRQRWVLTPPTPI